MPFRVHRVEYRVGSIRAAICGGAGLGAGAILAVFGTACGSAGIDGDMPDAILAAPPTVESTAVAVDTCMNAKKDGTEASVDCAVD